MLITTLRTQYKPLPAAAVEALDKAYEFDSVRNPEIRFRWYLLTLSSTAHLRATEAAEWLATQGRMKYVRPCYRALAKVDKQLAERTFKEHRLFYHPICGRIVAKVSWLCSLSGLDRVCR